MEFVSKDIGQNIEEALDFDEQSKVSKLDTFPSSLIDSNMNLR
jgi:hypothetical protein